MTDEILAALRNFQQYTSGLQGLLQQVQRSVPPGTEGADAAGAVTVRLGADGLPETVSFARDWERKCRPEALGGAITEAYGNAMSASMAAMQEAMKGMDVQGRADALRQDMERREREGPAASGPSTTAGTAPAGPSPAGPGGSDGDPGAPSWAGGGGDPGAPSWAGGGGDPGAPSWTPGGAGPAGPPGFGGPAGPAGPAGPTGLTGPTGPTGPDAPAGPADADPAPVDVPGRDLTYVVPRNLDEIAEEMMTAFDSVSGLSAAPLADAHVEGRDSGHRITVVLSKGALNSCKVDASWASGKSSVALGQAVEAALADGRAALARQEESSSTATQQRQLDGLLDEALAVLRDPKRFTGGL